MDAHLILKGDLHGLVFPDFLTDLSGVVIVEHRYGLIQKERPHYHCWVPGVFVGVSDSAKEPFRLKVREYYTAKWLEETGMDLAWARRPNALHAFKPHNCFDDWLKYAYTNADCKRPSILLWNRPGPLPDSPDVARSFDELIVPANIVAEVPKGSEAPITTASPGVSKSKKDPCYKRFLAYLNSENVMRPSLDDTLEYWFDWTAGNYELRNVSGPIRHAYYVLNDKDPDIRKMFVREMRRKLFSDV